MCVDVGLVLLVLPEEVSYRLVVDLQHVDGQCHLAAAALHGVHLSEDVTQELDQQPWPVPRVAHDRRRLPGARLAVAKETRVVPLKHLPKHLLANDLVARRVVYEVRAPRLGAVHGMIELVSSFRDCQPFARCNSFCDFRSPWQHRHDVAVQEEARLLVLLVRHHGPEAHGHRDAAAIVGHSSSVDALRRCMELRMGGDGLAEAQGA
mmetsp:Transcript_76067/g.211443  ORF Transcript_76067/g.211443 Transcript_76067/m.211443 type:complete len:207 (-) Transcript_76067:8-628(-)